MKTFRVIGSPTIYNLDRTYLCGNCIPAVVGTTEDGKGHTVTAESDIIWLEEAA